jgi:hypothetical protein
MLSLHLQELEKSKVEAVRMQASGREHGSRLTEAGTFASSSSLRMRSRPSRGT